MSGSRDLVVLAVAGMLLVGTVVGEIVIAELRREHVPLAKTSDIQFGPPSDPFAGQNAAAHPAPQPQPVTTTRAS